jgi:hypothetical protein
MLLEAQVGGISEAPLKKVKEILFIK